MLFRKNSDSSVGFGYVLPKNQNILQEWHTEPTDRHPKAQNHNIRVTKSREASNLDSELPFVCRIKTQSPYKNEMPPIQMHYIQVIQKRELPI